MVKTKRYQKIIAKPNKITAEKTARKMGYKKVKILQRPTKRTDGFYLMQK